MRNDNTIDKINKAYRKYVSDKWSNEILNKNIRCALKFSRPHQLLLALNNFNTSSFWRKYKNKYPSWILDRKRLSILKDMTCGLGTEYIEEIEEAEKLFIKYYNSFILHNYQEQLLYRPFIFKDQLSDDIRKAASFIILNKEKMYNIIEEEVPFEKLVFIFTAILFQIFEEPPCVFQYFKDNENFWTWFEEKAPECYDLYSYWNEWEWMGEPKELRFSTDQIKEYHKDQKKNKEAEDNSVRWNEILCQLEQSKS